MIRTAVIGASGYTGAELLRLLSGHPELEGTIITSRQHAGKKLDEVFPHLSGFYNLTFTEPRYDEIKEAVDAAFVCLPHKSAMEAVATLSRRIPVVDLSADFRFQNIATYETWYTRHEYPDLLETAVYGLPEIHRDKIRDARIIANPGCYPTGVILGLYPLLKEKAIRTAGIIIDSKSGLSGAGRNPSLVTIFTEVHESVSPYSVGSHRHTPEIKERLSEIAREPVSVTFAPHLVPQNRGILTTIYAEPAGGHSADTILEIFCNSYKDEPFVRVLPAGRYPATGWVRGSNCIDIGVAAVPETKRIVIMTAIDNLVKGASGNAVQNMNVLFGIDEKTGLSLAPPFP
jgi:N-acetyl-gamma-glutamyl-phosphate reductase